LHSNWGLYPDHHMTQRSCPQLDAAAGFSYRPRENHIPRNQILSASDRRNGVKHLLEIRQRAVAKGMKLMNQDEVLDEVRRRRDEDD
jgi:hypothetical protein